MLDEEIQELRNKYSIIGEKVFHEIAKLYGEEIYQLVENYGPLINFLEKDLLIQDMLTIPDEKYTSKQRKQLFSRILKTHFMRRGHREIASYEQLQMVLDFIPLNELPLNSTAIRILKKYGIEKLVEAGLDIRYIGPGEFLSNLDEISRLSEKIELKDLKELVGYSGQKALEKYSIEELKSFGIKDLNEIEKTIDDLEQVKELLETRPIDLISMGSLTEEMVKFIEKYGIDRIIELEKAMPIYLIDTFYKGRINAELINENPELSEILRGIDLGDVISNQIYVIPRNVNITESVSKSIKKVNMAEYFSHKIGYDETLKICMNYGSCLDYVKIYVKEDFSVQEIKEEIEKAIYKKIKEGMVYSEDLPFSFKEKYPDLFLPEEVDTQLRERFYKGELCFEDIRENPGLGEILLSKDIDVGFFALRHSGQIAQLTPEGVFYPENVNLNWRQLGKEEILYFAEKYGIYFQYVDIENFEEILNQKEDLEEVIKAEIEKNIFNRMSPFDEKVPEFFRQKYPEVFLDENAPQELKKKFYDGEKVSEKSKYIANLSFKTIKEHPEWIEFLKGKDTRRSFPMEYDELFKRIGVKELMRLGIKNPITIDIMAQNNKGEVLEKWYKATKGKYVPHHVVMLNLPEEKIDNFLGSTKKWNQLMKLERYNLDDDGKSALLKAAYCMGTFNENDDGFNKLMKLFSDVPQELTQEEYEKVELSIEEMMEIDIEMLNIFQKAYTKNAEGKYILRLNKQKDKEEIKKLREILETAQIPRILTPEKAHQIFDSFKMEYNPNFVKFFNENAEQILSKSEYITDIATIQRQFSDIVKINAGRKLTFEIAQNYIKSIAYTDIEIGNEGVAEQAKIAGYSQEDFEMIQKLYNEGEKRDYSSIPRIQGKTNGYSYEMLKLDDPLALTIGTLTDCCQEIHGAGQTSMEHSVVSPDGRVFCVKDEQGRLVAQSWFWRNQYTGCFDNIEIPHRIFEMYEKEHSEKGKKGLANEVLEIYKKAAQELMQEDERVYQELLEKGTITQEQYDALVLGKVTIGLGYNDIANAIKEDKTIQTENADEYVMVKETQRIPHPYTDASSQYIIAKRDGIKKSNYENLYVHQDKIPVYDETNMSNTVLFTLKRMEQEAQKNNLKYLIELDNEEENSNSQIIINQLAREYGLKSNTTKVMATARMALIYSKDENEIKIGELLTAPLKEGVTEGESKKATEHIMYQIKKALKQMGVQDSEVDLSILDEEQQKMIKTMIKEIREEEQER